MFKKKSKKPLFSKKSKVTEHQAQDNEEYSDPEQPEPKGILKPTPTHPKRLLKNDRDYDYSDDLDPYRSSHYIYDYDDNLDDRGSVYSPMENSSRYRRLSQPRDSPIKSYYIYDDYEDWGNYSYDSNGGPGYSSEYLMDRQYQETPSRQMPNRYQEIYSGEFSGEYQDLSSGQMSGSLQEISSSPLHSSTSRKYREPDKVIVERRIRRESSYSPVYYPHSRRISPSRSVVFENANEKSPKRKPRRVEAVNDGPYDVDRAVYLAQPPPEHRAFEDQPHLLVEESVSDTSANKRVVPEKVDQRPVKHQPKRKPQYHVYTANMAETVGGAFKKVAKKAPQERILSVTDYIETVPVAGYENDSLTSTLAKMQSVVYMPVVLLNKSMQISDSKVIRPEPLVSLDLTGGVLENPMEVNTQVFAASNIKQNNIFQKQETPSAVHLESSQSKNTHLVSAQTKSGAETAKQNVDETQNQQQSFLSQLFNRTDPKEEEPSMSEKDFPVQKSYQKVAPPNEQSRQYQEPMAASSSPMRETGVNAVVQSRSLVGTSKAGTIKGSGYYCELHNQELQKLRSRRTATKEIKRGNKNSQAISSSKSGPLSKSQQSQEPDIIIVVEGRGEPASGKKLADKATSANHPLVGSEIPAGSNTKTYDEKKTLKRQNNKVLKQQKSNLLIPGEKNQTSKSSSEKSYKLGRSHSSQSKRKKHHKISSSERSVKESNGTKSLLKKLKSKSNISDSEDVKNGDTTKANAMNLQQVPLLDVAVKSEAPVINFERNYLHPLFQALQCFMGLTVSDILSEICRNFMNNSEIEP